MEVILIRHAKTEKEHDDLDDIRRYLTEKGKKKFKKIIPKLKKKLDPLAERKIVLWSSPAIRAFETSHIVAGELDISINAIQDFIYDGEFENFKSAVQNIDNEATLLVVGHEPYLSEWTENMSGEDVEISTGDMLSFKVTEDSTLAAELQWIISSK